MVSVGVPREFKTSVLLRSTTLAESTVNVYVPINVVRTILSPYESFLAREKSVAMSCKRHFPRCAVLGRFRDMTHSQAQCGTVSLLKNSRHDAEGLPAQEAGCKVLFFQSHGQVVGG